MLYFNTKTYSVTSEPSRTMSEESFCPTVDIDEGWIMVYQFSTYDSFGPDDEIRTEIVDMYPSKEDAMEQANKMMEHVKRGKYDKNDPVLYANGKKVVYLPFFGWGSNFEKCFIKKVMVRELDYYEFNS